MSPNTVRLVVGATSVDNFTKYYTIISHNRVIRTGKGKNDH